VPLQIAAGTIKHVVVDAVAAASSPVRATVVDSAGASVTSAAASIGIVTGSDPTTVAVVSDQDSTLDAFGEVTLPGGNQVQVVHLVPNAVPDSAALLQGFGAVVLDDASTQELTAAQLSGLADFVTGGGTLVVCGGVQGSSTADGLPAELVPAQVSGSNDATLPRLAGFLRVPPLGSTAELSRLAPREGVVTLAEGSTPLIIEGLRGSGRVVVLAFDPSSPPFAGWPGTPVLLRQLVMLATASNPSFSAANGGATVAFGGGPVPLIPGLLGPVAGLARMTNVVGGTVVDIPSFSLPSSGLLVALLVGYVLLLGPVNFWVLARLRRRELAWITVPVLSALVAVLAYGSGLGTNDKPSLTEIRVVTVHPGSNRAEVDSWGALYLPHGGTHQLSLPTGSLVTGLGMGTNSPAVETADAPRVALSGGSAAVSAYAATRQAAVPGSVVAQLSGQGGTIAGTVVNHLGVGLTDAVVVASSGATQVLGFVPSNGTAQVRLTASSLNANSGSSFGFSPGMPGDLFTASGISTSAQRAALRRQQVLPALEALAVQEAGEGPVLVALADGPALAPDVHGPGIGVTDLDAVIVPLGVSEPTGSGHDLVQGQLVDQTGATDATTDGAVSLAARGSALFRFELPAGRHWSRLALTLAAPPPWATQDGIASGGYVIGGASSTVTPAVTGPGTAPAPASGGGPYTVEVFDPATGGWDAAGSTSGIPATVVLPGSAFDVGAGGVVVVRITAGGAGIMMGETPVLAADSGAVSA
jgi:hypothetical protein